MRVLHERIEDVRQTCGSDTVAVVGHRQLLFQDSF
jgi:hypothetical protein